MLAMQATRPFQAPNAPAAIVAQRAFDNSALAGQAKRYDANQPTRPLQPALLEGICVGVGLPIKNPDYLPDIATLA